MELEDGLKRILKDQTSEYLESTDKNRVPVPNNEWRAEIIQ